MKKRFAVLVEEQYQDLEVWYPLIRLKEAGCEVTVIGPESDKEYKGKFGYPIKADLSIDVASTSDYDGVIIPGGWAPDFLRRNHKIIQFVKDMDKAGKLVASICHGGWVLVSAGILKGRKATSFFAIKEDLINAGAKYRDEEVVVDKNLITSRTPDDLPAFCQAILKKFS